MDAGRRLERALQITGLLRACLSEAAPPTAEELVMESVLIAAESIITHRRRYPARSGPDTVLDLLLLDAGNPRSVSFQLDRLAVDLAELPSGTEVRDRLLLQVRRIVTLARSADTAALSVVHGHRRNALEEFLDALAEELKELSALLHATHFIQPAPLHALGEFTVAGPL